MSPAHRLSPQILGYTWAYPPQDGTACLVPQKQQSLHEVFLPLWPGEPPCLDACPAGQSRPVGGQELLPAGPMARIACWAMADGAHTRGPRVN